MSSEQRIGFIGGGKMGGAIIHALLERGVAMPTDIIVCEPVAARREELRRDYGVGVTSFHGDAVAGVDALVLAVKPQEFATAAATIRSANEPIPLTLSIMAGVRLATMAEALPGARIVRAMPNLGATVGASYSMWTAAPDVTEADRVLVRALLESFGQQRETASERELDMATAVAGSGPGYVTLMIEALIDGAVQIGLPRGIATEMVLQTMLGTVRWAQADGGHPAALRAQVVSPGGTTAEGVLALEAGGVRAGIMHAVIAGFEKSRALGG